MPENNKKTRLFNNQMSKPMEEKPKSFPPQEQAHQPGKEQRMTPQPEYVSHDYKAAGKLQGKRALITGGDSGIGRAVAVHFAKEGADVAIVYLDEQKDAEDTKQLVEKEGKRCLLLKGDISDPAFCKQVPDMRIETNSRGTKKPVIVYGANIDQGCIFFEQLFECHSYIHAQRKSAGEPITRS